MWSGDKTHKKPLQQRPPYQKPGLAECCLASASRVDCKDEARVRGGTRSSPDQPQGPDEGADDPKNPTSEVPSSASFNSFPPR